MKNIKAFLLAAALLVGIQYASAAWTDPSATPPNANTDAPLNIGSSIQQKLGSLVVNSDTSNPYAVGLTVFGGSNLAAPVNIGGGSATPSNLVAEVNGNVGASQYCDQNGKNCQTIGH
jgi:hypothetical protein